MLVNEFIKISKELLRIGNKSGENRTTINTILVALRIRNAYYCDDDKDFTSLPASYQKLLLQLCNVAGLSLKFFSDKRWLLYNDNIKSVDFSSHKSIGKILDFPCTSSAFDLGKQTSQKLGVDLQIKTKEYGDINITSFICFKSEKPAIKAWFYKKQQQMSILKEFIKDAQPYIKLIAYKSFKNELTIDSTEIYGL
jgi:hypothetical protein